MFISEVIPEIKLQTINFILKVKLKFLRLEFSPYAHGTIGVEIETNEYCIKVEIGKTSSNFYMCYDNGEYYKSKESLTFTELVEEVNKILDKEL